MKESEKEHCCCHQEHEREHHCGCGHNHEHNEEHHCCCGHHDHCDDHCECGEKDVNLYDKIRETLDKYSYSLTAEQAEHEAAHIMEHHYEENNNPEVWKFLLSSLELTSLKVTDNDESILAMVENRLRDHQSFF